MLRREYTGRKEGGNAAEQEAEKKKVLRDFFDWVRLYNSLFFSWLKNLSEGVKNAVCIGFVLRVAFDPRF